MHMTRTVLLALDRSDKDARAIAAAEGFAELMGGRIHMVHVLGGVAGVDPAEVSDGATSRHDEAREWLKGTRAVLATGSGGAPTSEMIVSLEPAAKIVAAAGSVKAELIVLATRAATTIGRALLGSVADQVIRAADCPVALVPPGVQQRRASPIRKVLVPLDGSRDAARIVEKLRALSNTALLHFVLVHVAKTELTDGYAIRAALPMLDRSRSGEVETSNIQVSLAKTELDEIAGRIRDAGLTADVHVIEAGNPDDEIIKVAQAQSVDFIAMTTRGLQGMSRWLIGSVADGVTSKSPVPVLIMPR